MPNIRNFFILLNIIVLFPFDSFPFSLSFLSHTTIEGYIYDKNGDPISNVEVKSFKDNFLKDPFKNNISYNTFSDSLGYFRLNLILEDNEFNGFVNLDNNQKTLCLNYCHNYERISHLFNNYGKTVGNNIKLNENIYKRKITISFSKIGYFDMILDTSVSCKMDRVSSPINLFNTIILSRNSNFSTFRNINSKVYSENKFSNINGSDNTFIINGRTIAIGYKIENINDLFNPNYVFDDINSKFRRSNYYLFSSNILSISSVYIGILGICIFHNKSDFFYPIYSGLALYSTGVAISYFNIKYRRRLIIQYNDRLLNKLKQTSN